jgi:hypothetical protein
MPIAWESQDPMSPQIAKRSSEARCARTAERQYGVIARGQALALGMSAAMIRNRLRLDRWEVLFPSVYRICGAPPSPLHDVMAACLWARDGIAFGLTAAAAWELEGGSWTPPEIATRRRMTNPDGRVISRRISTFCRTDRTKIGVLPVTSPARAIIDLSCRVPEAVLEIALDQLLRRGLLTVERLLRRVQDLSSTRTPGLAVLRDLARSRSGSSAQTETELETLMRWWLREYGFPEPAWQYWVTLPDYGPARLDCAYPELRIGIEADSYKWHSSRRAFERDRSRNSELASLGWLIIQTTKGEIEADPLRLATRLRRARSKRLENRGLVGSSDFHTMG